MSDIKIVDARGLSCPQPVILARQAIAKGEFPIQVLMDTGTSRDNVTRMAQSAGCQVNVEAKGQEFVVTISK
jgi:tRNA 2-thiouridine synthesizing protein A